MNRYPYTLQQILSWSILLQLTVSIYLKALVKMKYKENSWCCSQVYLPIDASIQSFDFYQSTWIWLLELKNFIFLILLVIFGFWKTTSENIKKITFFNFWGQSHVQWQKSNWIDAQYFKIGQKLGTSRWYQEF